MNKKYTKTVFSAIAVITLVLAPFTYANAGIMAWVRSVVNNGGKNEKTTGPNDIFLNPEMIFAVKVAEEKKSAKLEIIQGNSLVQANNPFGINIFSSKNIAPATVRVARELTVPATAYSSTPDQTDDSPFVTAMGTYVRDGIVAANFLPFGTQIRIPDIYGDKIFVVEDRMNKRYWHKVDIWFPDRESAMEFGLKNIRVEILES